MPHFTDRTRTTNPSQLTPKTEGTAPSPEAGRRLSEAQSADREWRGELARRLHRQLGNLRKYDLLIERGGAAVSVCLLVAAMVLPFRGASVEQVMSLVTGAIFSSVGALAVITGIAWAYDRTRRWIARLGLTEACAPTAQEADAAGEAARETWICSGCRSQNPVDATACSACARLKQVEESRLSTRIGQVGRATENLVMNFVKVFLCAMLVLFVMPALGVLLTLIFR